MPLSKKCCIHDNFVYVQSVIKALHKSKRPALFIKLDISKAFDSLSWVFLLEVMKALGFGQKWRDWITTLLATSSSRVLLNGTPGEKIQTCSRSAPGRSTVTTTFYPSHRPPSKNNRAGSPKKRDSPGPPKGGNIKMFPICR